MPSAATMYRAYSCLPDKERAARAMEALEILVLAQAAQEPSSEQARALQAAVRT